MKTEANDPITGLANQLGLTKREAFVMAAMQGLSACEYYSSHSVDKIAEMSVLQADALIKALNQKEI